MFLTSIAIFSPYWYYLKLINYIQYLLTSYYTTA